MGKTVHLHIKPFVDEWMGQCVCPPFVCPPGDEKISHKVRGSNTFIHKGGQNLIDSWMKTNIFTNILAPG